MQKFLESCLIVRDCYDNYNPAEVVKMDELKLIDLCYSERMEMLKALMELNTRSLIYERLEILKMKEKERANARRAYLDRYFKE